MTQLHKRFSDDQVKVLLERYCAQEVNLVHILAVLNIKRRHFFRLLKEYRENPEGFSIVYNRTQPGRIGKAVETNIVKELMVDKTLIENPDMPVKRYNYTYIKTRLWQEYRQKVSVPTIISRAKQYDCYRPRPERKAHDREVLTNYPGQLIQHDSSQHQWSPYADKKWYLVTSLDDYSRMLLFADFFEKELSWNHICALEKVFLRFGLPLSYYVDSHRIFRYVHGRDTLWQKHYKATDEADPQWKQVMIDCNVQVTHAMSPQAKGKIERPYGWLQDNIVRTCARENIRDINLCRQVLKNEVDRYNNHQVHSTTREVPVIRFHNAINNKRSLFRPFCVPPPYQSTKDIFCLRAQRRVNGYRRISFHNVEFKVPGAPIYEMIKLRIVPDEASGMAEIRFWFNDKLLDTQKVKNEDLDLVHF